MFGTIRRHQTWLWAFLIAVMIIGLISWSSQSSKFNANSGETADYGAINGQPVSRELFTQARKDILLRYYLSNGSWPTEEAKKSGFDEMGDAYKRLLLIQKEEQLGIHIGSDIVAQFAQNILRAHMRKGINTPEDFVKQLLEPSGFTMEDLERCLRHELGIQELVSVIGLSGKLVTPDEIKSLYIR